MFRGKNKKNSKDYSSPQITLLDIIQKKITELILAKNKITMQY
jgi:hypothetical protein